MQTTRSNYSTKLLEKQFQMLVQQGEKELGVNAGLNDDKIDEWNIIFEGPKDSLYDGGYFKIFMKFPEKYPELPPEMYFRTKMWHPNIYPDGKVCISILHPPGKDQFNEQEREDEKWRPVLTPFDILLSVISMLQDPNIDSIANVDAGVMFKDRREEYIKKVKKYTIESVEQL